MSVEKVSLLNNVSFGSETPKEKPSATQKTPDEIKDGSKKLALALGGLAAVGIGAVLISRGRKVPSEISIEEFKKIGKFDKGIAKAKGKLYTGVINVPKKDGNVILEYEKGILKQSTGYKISEISGSKPFLLPNIKKVYSRSEDGTRTVESFLYNINHKTFGGKEWGQIGTTTVLGDKVVVEHIDGLTGDKLQDITVKQQDGSWFKTIQEIDYDFDTAGTRRILTKNAKTGEVLQSETKTLEMPSAPEGKVTKNEAGKRHFIL